MLKETSLIAAHQKAGGKLVDFGGWNMPLHYGSQMQEHHYVRESAGMFDVSHMTVLDLSGSQSEEFLRYLLANDVQKLKTVGKALYSGMLNEQGGVIDDLIVYRMADGFRLIVNCATREKDLAWIAKQIDGYDAAITERDDLSMIAVQGPKANAAVASLFDEAAVNAIGVFHAQTLNRDGHEYFVARTGYTGEDGFEILVANDAAEELWDALIALDVKPCGLGARDTLRLEAGMNLYGHEMDENISPLVANMAWTVAWAPEDRNFIGRDVIRSEFNAGVKEKLVGLVMKGKGVLRAEQEITKSGVAGKGIITSGTFSPSLGVSIALARVPVAFEGACHANIRGRELAVEIVKPCFIRKGQKVF